jgi:YfiH family protein
MELWRERASPDFLIAFSRRGAPASPSPTTDLAREFALVVGEPGIPIAWAQQVHGIEVLEAKGEIGPGEARQLGQGDILVTREKGLALAVQTADCVPILLVSGKAVAAVHAGWRGTAKSAASAGVRALRERFGIEPGELRAYLGPAIGSCCYEVGGEVAANFAGEFLRRECGGKFRLDLKAANRAQLEESGVPASGITVLPHCTACGGSHLASYRRDRENSGRMIALVARL